MDLQQTRQGAAERFEQIGLAHVPEGWNVKFRKALMGRSVLRDKRIVAPRPRTRKALYVFLNECAHAHLHGGTGKRSPRYVEQMEAERWACAKMREHGIPVPWAMTKSGKAYVADKIRQAVARAKRIDSAAKHYGKSKS